MAKKKKVTGEKKGKAPGDKKRKGRRARGTGSIFFSDAAGKWIGRKTVGKTAKGKPRRVEVWADTQTEVVKKLAAAQPPGTETTVEQWSTRWLAGLDVRESTRVTYDTSLAHILAKFGCSRLSEVQPSQVREFLVGLMTGDEPLASGTVQNVRALGRTMFDAAAQDGLLSRNPFAVKIKPRDDKKPIDPFSPDQLLRIIATASPGSSGPEIATLAGVGCRIGEAAELDVTDWDSANGTLSISKTYPQRFGIGPPKSKHSTRTIGVPSVLHPILNKAAGTRTTGPLFLTQKNRRVIKELAWRSFGAHLKRLGLRPRNLHQLRHSVATALISRQVPIGDVAKYLGDTVATLVKTYLHPTGTDPRMELDKMFGS